MPDLLLHSMAEFGDLMVDVLRLAGAKTVVEIGAEGGESTRVLLEHTEKAGGELVVIDPAPSPAAEALIGRHRHARLVKQTSLEVLPSLAADAYLIDGDHNYYTVSRESTLIWEQCEAAGKPFLALYHDVCWPWARRDLYYDPSRIPPEHLKPHAWDRGVTLDQPRAIAGGFRGEGQWACAIEEGGPKNGVMTAIEEFVIGREHALAWACVLPRRHPVAGPPA
jgi:hypothetical protein